jgi:hypothetical protein
MKMVDLLRSAVVGGLVAVFASGIAGGELNLPGILEEVHLFEV